MDLEVRMNKRSVLLVDGYSLIHRGFHALPLLSSGGVYTNAVQGFFSMLFKAMTDYRPDYLCVMMDMHAPTFRHTMYEEYKGTRKPTPEELRPQFDVVREILKAMDVRVCELEGYEADDLLGTAARIAGQQDIDAYILTGDRDSLQLAGGNTRIILTKTGISESLLLDAQGVEENYGYTPAQVPDMKGLMGDSSDNIPGIAGVGEKTALKLIKQYGSLDSVLAHADEVKGKLGEKLRGGKEDALLSRDLGTIRTTAPLKLNVSDCTTAHMTQALPVLEKYQLTRLAQALCTLAGTSAQNSAVETESLSRGEVSEAMTEKEISVWLDVHAQGENSLLIGADAITVCAQDGALLRCPLQRDLLGGGLYEDQILGAMRPALESAAWVVNGAKTLDKMLAGLALPLPTIAHDTLLGAYLLSPNQKSYDLSQDADAHTVRELCASQRTKLEEQGMTKLLLEMEQPLTAVLFSMEQEGFGVDAAVLERLGEKWRAELAECRESIYQLTGVEGFNILSPKQLGEVLFDKLGLPAQKKGKAGARSTDAEVLEGLLPYHPAIESILQYRQLSKLMGTYVDGLLKLIDPNGRVHTTFDQTATLTGRISSLEPNLQNIPVRTEQGREIRRAFIAGEGKVLLDADYSQIELRVLAHLSGDPAMQDAFVKGQDIHARTAAEIGGIAIEQVTPDQRRAAKAVNFGIVYGISGFGLAKNAGVSRREADAFIEKYLSNPRH
ncbi:MAG: DNA polymerase I, partial [Clostridia bacterium]|nr:DNA polymerase I [Clostridia bacterium]